MVFGGGDYVLLPVESSAEALLGCGILPVRHTGSQRSEASSAEYNRKARRGRSSHFRTRMRARERVREGERATGRDRKRRERKRERERER